MENFLGDAWAALSEAYNKLQLAKQAQEEDDNNCENEELSRTKEQFVERIETLTTYVGSIQSEIMAIIYEHNHKS